MNLTEICAYLKNYFTPCIHKGNFEITDGQIINADFLKSGQYFRIIGSVLNDGVFCNCPDDLKTLQNEEFDTIWAMNIPPDFLKLCQDIQAWRTRNETPESINMSPFTSESFGGYSYSKNSGNSVTWQKQFSERLNIWRKI